MRELQAGVFFVFATACAVFLVVFVRPQRITGTHLSEDAPTEFVPMPESSQTQNVVPALDPRVDMETDISFTPPPETPPVPPAETDIATGVPAGAAIESEAASVDGAESATEVQPLAAGDSTASAESTAASDSAASDEVMAATESTVAPAISASAERMEPLDSTAEVESTVTATPPVEGEASTAAAPEGSQPGGGDAPVIEIVQPPAPPSGVRPSDLRVIAAADGAHPELPADRPSDSPVDSPASGVPSEDPADAPPETSAPGNPGKQ